MSAGKAVIGQSGGPTAVINRSLVGFIKEAVNHNFDEILELFDRLINSFLDNDAFSELNNYIINILSSFENEKLKIYISLIKFILITLKKIKIGININDHYLSSYILKIINISNNISEDCINNKLDYLINNENDLFTFNLDKKIFMINFFAVS